MRNAPLSNSNFTLDASGVAGFFGGDEAVSAMATVHMYQGRKWLGWYNSPGSYLVGKRYGQLANSRFWDGLFPGVNTDPATLFELDGRKGPKFKGVESGSTFPETSHLAALMASECQAERGIEVPGRKTQPVGVTIVHLHHVPDASSKPKQLKKYTSILAFIPISASIGTCIMCAFFGDWYSFSMILLGILASGISCFVIGSGKFTFYHPIPASGSPRGDGLLLADGNVIVLLGEEGAVNSITRGKFSLNFGTEPEYRNIGICSLLLTTQFVAQLLLIPQAALFGQIMFVISLAVSWAYNSWLSSLDKEEIQRRLLLDVVLDRPSMTKYILGTRTTMAVFVLLALNPSDPGKVLDDILPNDTKVWMKWKSAILSRLKNRKKMHFDIADWDDENFDEKEGTLLKTLLGDAQAAYDGYSNHMKSH
ncbi:hypothetical protein K503DRAFT_775240 [Rhizopogon vinicolor AM-OR11-026]|uniref:Uncharacterized protein n=1 Tax=Rhizopogon vinicolor AM-OR11-026 TaxID=1314800 RepID=A0A1B7MMD5_9AGAM|nr:hypothetical protein K503DRAFT_775240 [Rhizopogon vinicolor AM-OR11-026]